MFGTYRTYLALIVMAHHLLKIPLIGHYAVHGFFILSGYLMTYVMHNSYGYTKSGFSAFCANRAIRLYPIYWTVLVFTIIIITVYGNEAAQAYREFIYLPTTIGDWASNITLIYPNLFPTAVSPRLSPPTWALTVELFYYLLIGLGISRSYQLTLCFLSFSVGYFATTYLAGLDYEWRYSSIISGSLPFALGALIYHKRQQIIAAIDPYQNKKCLTALLFAFIANPLIALIIFKYTSYNLTNASYFLNYIINFTTICFLINGKIPFVSKKLDNTIGELSYPIYLFHWQAGLLCSYLLFDRPVIGLSRDGIISFAVATALTLTASYILVTCIDRPVNTFRKLIKAKANDALVRRKQLLQNQETI